MVGKGHSTQKSSEHPTQSVNRREEHCPVKCWEGEIKDPGGLGTES